MKKKIHYYLSIDPKPISIALPGDFGCKLVPTLSSAELKKIVSTKGSVAVRPPESASSRPWKYFFVRVTRVPSQVRRGAPFWARPTRLFARGQTSRRGLSGNCWKHLASVYSVIEARSHLGVQVLWKPCYKRSDVVWLRNFEYDPLRLFFLYKKSLKIPFNLS